MRSRSDKISQINTPYAQQMTVNQQLVRRAHIKRCKRILLIFSVVFLLLGFQIIQSKRSLAKIEASIRTSKTQLARQRILEKTLNKKKSNYIIPIICNK